MSNLRQAAQQAILLCQWIDKTPHQRGSINGMAAQVKHALEQALAEPEQEPVAWVELTDEEQLELARDSMGRSRHWLVAQVEAKLKEKNT